ncbi:succinoglycan transporter ExoP [Dulcicalothrix desertica PCC 7102]|uniref:non-specific protein-tyrosine kinase n=1 Tax=Dulcicalothrix desertica PCC 7102 TaxID=232991 RepID=A0A433VM77_9CYAN|nr:polysaccharide biosynthesis tyrosine autokinase [Dulcicalothrix desertica]RUT07191.1 succinoglycan transporter ExoP [Dulcicalothrix desertica PCC 7102]TWH61815.1 capsular exopolysaccharide synthesis family protein [Dulcicalothrix desertica PCC 7102]
MMSNSSKLSISNMDENLAIQSQPIVTQALVLPEGQESVLSLRDYFGILKRRGLMITGVTTVLIAGVAGMTMRQKPEYEGNFRLLVEPPVNNENALSNLTPTENKNTVQPQLDYETQIQILKSPKLIKEVVSQLQVSHPEIDYDTLTQSLTVTRLGETKIIETRYKSKNSEEVKQVLDKLASTYLKYSREQRQTRLRQGVQFVEQQLKPLQSRVAQLQKAQQIFRQKYSFYDPNTQTAEISARVKNLSEQRLVIDQKLAEARSNFASLKGEQGQLAILKDAPVYQQQLIELRQLDAKIAAESARFVDDSPTILTLKERRQNLLPLLQQEAKRFLSIIYASAATQVKTLESQSQELAASEQQLLKKQDELPALTRQYNELQRQLQAATDSLNRFQATRETLQIQGAQTELRWELVQPPTKPIDTVSPNIPRNLILGFVASSLLGVGAGLLLEKLDERYHSVNSVKDKVPLPLLATIPTESRVKKLREPEESGRFVEALRVLHTNIQLIGNESSIRSLVVSSSIAGEGKSTVAFHLAQIATSMGLRVLLVDADLRNSKIHSLCDIDNEQGLTDLISTKMPIKEAIQKLPYGGQLSVISSGSQVSDPANLLSSTAMKCLMAELHKSFDLVIYDTPQMEGLADTSLLTPHVDGVLLVTRIHKTERPSLMKTLDNLRIGRVNVLGLVVNGI